MLQRVMELPQEIEAFYAIPAVRRELARRLVALGMTQRDVARKLEVTDAAVSQYLSNKRGTAMEFSVQIDKALTDAAQRIRSASSSLVVRKELQLLVELLKSQKVICDIHRKHGTVKEGCSTCFE